MNRKYKIESYLDMIAYAKERIPDIAISSDIIVGFPNETYEDFLKTIDVIKEVEFLSLFMFIYSKRVGTKAAEMEDNTSEEDKGRWFRELVDLQRQISHKLHKKYVGKTLRVLAETEGKTSEKHLSGRSDEGVIVEFIAPKEYLGQFVNVKVTTAFNWAVIGELINNEENKNERN